jgi:hypothetical protein
MKYQLLTTVMVVLPSAASTFVLKAENNHKMPHMWNGNHYEKTNNINKDFELPLRSKYRKDIDSLNLLLDSKGVHQLDQIKHLIKDIQQTRQEHPEVALPQKLRDALSDYRNAEAKYGADSREAKVAYAYLCDIFVAKGLKPRTYPMNEGMSPGKALEELKEIAHGEKCKCHWNRNRRRIHSFN